MNDNRSLGDSLYDSSIVCRAVVDGHTIQIANFAVGIKDNLAPLNINKV